MEIKSTTGRPGLGGTRKDYVIRTKCGEKYYAKAVGSQGYECGGVNYGSLKALKAAIIAGEFAEAATDASEVSTADGADTWDCVHPCALLVIFQNTILQGRYKLTVIETLEAYGWLDCMGRPDIARAEREITRVVNLKKRSE